jgi:hypothetical protein
MISLSFLLWIGFGLAKMCFASKIQQVEKQQQQQQQCHPFYR